MWSQFLKTEVGEADIHPLVTIVPVIREITPPPNLLILQPPSLTLTLKHPGQDLNLMYLHNFSSSIMARRLNK